MKKILILLIFCSRAIAAPPELALSQMSLEEKIGQLFIAPACPHRGEEHRRDLRCLMEKFHLSSFILMQGTPRTQIDLVQALEKTSKIPLLFAQDAEWGLSMRLSETVRYPKNLTLGAIRDLHLHYLLGQRIALDCQQVGVSLNFAPVVDVNLNPLNPVIHRRSFGEDPFWVGQCAASFMQGMQEAGVMACGKHFPGHGDTTTDSHIDLPVLSENKQRFEAFEFVPFKALIQADVATLMIGHLAAPQLSLNEHLPATFSEKIVKNILRDELHFEGVIITDSLSMQALARTYPFQEIAKRAHLAGCHLLLYADHIDAKVDELLQKTIPEAIGALKKAYEDGDFSLEMLDEYVLKILRLKTKLRKLPLSSKTAYETIHSEKAKALKKTLYQNALTLLANPDALLPLTLDAEKKIALLSVHEKSNFLKALKKYANIESIEVTSCSPNIQQLKPYDVVIVPLYTSQPGKSGFEIPSEQRALLDKLQANAIKTIVVLFTTPYALSSLNPHFATIVAYEDDPDAEEAAAGLIFGLYEPKGKLPVTGAPWCPLGSGLSWNETVD